MLDKTQFTIQSHKEAAQTDREWLETSAKERLSAAYELSLRAYGLNPEEEHPLDHTC